MSNKELRWGVFHNQAQNQ